MLKLFRLFQLESRGLLILIFFQFLCTVFFVYDSTTDMRSGDADLLHMLPELFATLCLVIGILVETHFLLKMLRKQQDMSHSLGVAAGALADIMNEHFEKWKLTPAEHDVAVFAIKGYSISEIASMRGSAEGTVKTHLNAIYRKSGAQGQAQLVSLLIEDLLRAPLVTR